MNEKTKNALLSIVASLVCIVIGLLVGFIIYTASTRRTQWMDLHESSKAAFT